MQTERSKLPYYTELDGVRGCAAFLIFLFHFFHGYAPANQLSAAGLQLISMGSTMANLFFVLSSFLITQILLSSKEKGNYFSNYYARRMLRIFPLYYVLLAIYFFIMPPLRGASIPGFSMQWYNWLYLQNLPLTFKWPHAGPKYLWSLAVEEHFYLFWPILIYFLNKRQIIITCLLIFLAAFVCRIVLFQYNYPVFFFTLSTMDAFAAGAVAGLLQFNNQLSKYRTHIKYAMLLTGIPAVILWLMYFGERNETSFICLPVLFNIFYAAALSYIITSGQDNKIKKALSSRALVFSGTISYGIFLFHPLCNSFVLRSMPSSGMFIKLLLSLSASVIISTISYYYFEKWFIGLKRYF